MPACGSPGPAGRCGWSRRSTDTTRSTRPAAPRRSSPTSRRWWRSPTAGPWCSARVDPGPDALCPAVGEHDPGRRPRARSTPGSPRLLEVPADQLNLEGATVVADSLRWFQRGLPSAGAPSASVDVDLDGLLDHASGSPAAIRVSGVRRYDLGTVAGVGLAITDAISLSGGLVLVSATAEDSRSTYDDGPVVGSALALLDGDRLLDLAELPLLDGEVAKLEGLAAGRASRRRARPGRGHRRRRPGGAVAAAGADGRRPS